MVVGGCDSLGGDGIFVSEKFLEGDGFVAFSELEVASFELEGLAICLGLVLLLGLPGVRR